jgi:hypothetical protein
MAWERRPAGGRYYYRSRRQDDKVIKQYFGRGKIGRLAAEADQAARDARRHAAQRRKEESRPVDELTCHLDEFGELVDQLVTCQLLCAGARKHKRQWRLPKHGRIRSRN